VVKSALGGHLLALLLGSGHEQVTMLLLVLILFGTTGGTFILL
jgi:hypothetical protein